MKKSAFTLIELLVVIAIIALLLTIVMPSLMLAKEQARDVYCRNNLKQMCIAAATYTVGSDDYYPIAHYSMTVEQSSAPQTVGFRSYTNIVPEDEAPQVVTYSYCWDYTTIKMGDRIQTIPGILWQGDTIEKVQQCPSFKGSDNWGGNEYTGYNYNTSYIGHGQGESVDRSTFTGQVSDSSLSSGQSIVLSAKASYVNSPAGCALFGEGHYAGGANKFMRSPMTWKGDTDWTIRPAGTQGFRHNLQTNIGWVDGHISGLKEYYTDTHPKYKSSLDSYNKTNKVKIGFISPSNSLYDLK